MNVTDPLADLLTRIRNAQRAKHDIVMVPASKMKIAITHLLKEEGFVRAYKCVRDGKQGLIKIALKYDDSAESKPVINELYRVSKSSCRRYVGWKDIPYVKNGFGIVILSTSQGVMTCREARKRQLGGEHLLSVF